MVIGLIVIIALFGGIYSQFGSSDGVSSGDAANAGISGVSDPIISGINGRVMSMKFFESSDPDKRRVYQDRFSSAQTQAISWELGVNYPAPPDDVTSFFVEAIWHDANGEIIQQMRQECQLSSHPSVSYFTGAFGREHKRPIPAGKYTVQIFYHNSKVAERVFEVY